MTVHASSELLARYIARDGTPAPADPVVWSLESHLEVCPDCRGRLANMLDPGTAELIDRIRQQVTSQTVGVVPVPAAPRWAPWMRTMVVSGLPWLAVTAGILVTAMLFDLAYPQFPSLVLLTAPVAPLLCVAAIWSSRFDPAFELVAATPRAGLWMLLRRTLGILTALAPLLVLVGWIVGQSPALWLLPCLAFTGGTLAFGGLVGVWRAAIGLATAWAAGVVAPTLVSRQMSLLLQADSQPGWAIALGLVTALALVRIDSFRRLASRH